MLDCLKFQTSGQPGNKYINEIETQTAIILLLKHLEEALIKLNLKWITPICNHWAAGVIT